MQIDSPRGTKHRQEGGLGDYLEHYRHRIEKILKRQLSSAGVSSRPLRQAMVYGVLGGGKRLRPVLAYASAEAMGGTPEAADIPACALEMIHAYSLIHDDLPAMDDDALRRGKPTCHKVYGEAMAILAGDALQSLAFELLAGSPELAVSHRTRLRMIGILSRAAGRHGMVGGQALDLAAVGTAQEEATLSHIHGLKTGALIRASVLLGGLSTNLATNSRMAALERYARCVGLAFQVQDDILDVTGDTGTLGKERGRDNLLNKPTYVSLLGLEGAVDKARELSEEAVAALEPLGSRGAPLRQLAQYVIQRVY